MEDLYGFKPKKRVYTAEEMDRSRKRLEQYTAEKTARRDRPESENGQKGTSQKARLPLL